MRHAGFLTVLACLALPVTAAAQDPFADVPNEPRPDEYLHWNAEAVAGFQGELDEALRNGEGIWGTPFVVATALPRADHRPHSVQIIHRAGYTQPEIHTTKWDLYVVLRGAGTVLVGGERVNWIDGRPPEEQRPQLEGAQAFEVAEGDLLHVPARSWHQVVVPEGSSITYALINVFE
jgi:mannose-6-phosphate isomerase-like protein (cupin superfamily)